MVLSGARTFFTVLLVGLLSSPGLVAMADTGATPQDPDATAVRLGGHQPFRDADDVRFELVDVTSFFGPEVYKETHRTSARNLPDAENQTTSWNTSLGHAISFTVEVEAGPDTTLPCDERFEAETYIVTGQGRLYGWTDGPVSDDPMDIVECQGVAGTRTFNLTFDLDGAPASATGGAYHALAGGSVHTAVLDLYYTETPSVSDPTGRGPLAGSYEVTFGLAGLHVGLGERALQRFPDDILRLFSDVGTGTHFQMPLEAYNTSETVTFDLGFSGAATGSPYTLMGHIAQRVAGGGVERPTTLPAPLGPASGTFDRVATSDDASIDVSRVLFDTGDATVPDNRSARFEISAGDLSLGDGPVPLYAITLHTPATPDNLVTGAASIVLPVARSEFPVRGIEAQSGTGPVGANTLVRLQDSARVAGGATGSDAGDLFAFRTTAGFGHHELTRSMLERTGDDRWIRGTVDHQPFKERPDPLPTVDPVGAYGILAMVYDADDAFYGLSYATRGISLETETVRLVEGRGGELPVRVTSLTTDHDDRPREADYDMNVEVRVEGLPDGRVHIENVTLAEGAFRLISVPVRAPQPGVFSLTVVATSAELTERLDVALDVMSTEEAAELEREWYDIPAVPVPLVAMVLVALAAWVRTRRHG